MHRNSIPAMIANGPRMRRWPSHGLPALWVQAIVDRWRTRQAVAVRARLVAPAIRTRLALADRAFALALKTQHNHALVDGREIVGGAGCVRRHLGPMDRSPGAIAPAICTRHARRRLLNRKILAVPIACRAQPRACE